MPATLDSFADNLKKLISKFEADKHHTLSKGYLEAQARTDFISPFFRALGWDVENEAGLPHHEREVLVERGEYDTEGRPDYSFRLGGQTKFFVEAKAPSETLDVPHHILQAKGYAWNTKSVFFVILTDFVEFRFYDASVRPDERKPDEGRLLRLRYDEYPGNVEKLWEFSKERVAAGSLDAMLPRDRRTQRLRIPVDQAFLDEMTGWREDLARNVYKNNPDLTAKQLNEVVQRLLDRIVFIRIAEDRRIIEKRQLADAVEEWRSRGGKLHIYEWLNDLFHKINEDFNGEIFKPHLSETIRIDSEVLARIIERLYPPKSPYRFDVIGVELLGSIYERYLGKTIRPTAKTVRVEEKPEVRKAGGVYYTPKYIVDYIVKNTVGKVIEGKTPKQIEKIRILDPACGSGSFLIGTFQCLIDYHVKWYLAHPEQEVRHAHPSLDFMREVHTDPDGGHRLSVYRKAKILRNNLFGVDIDPQAVEITMMSLYLKALEGEKSQLPPKQHLLPELKYNIICGNSLIGPDIYDQGTLFGDEEKDRINAFDWNAVAAIYDRRNSLVERSSTLQSSVAPVSSPAKERRRDAAATAGPVTFGDIMRSGGFDCVIGNPPYIRIQHMKEWAPFEVEHYKARYKAASSGNYDIYVVFVEKGLSVLKPHGNLGFILPHKFFNSKYGEPLRGLLAQGKHLSHIVHFGDQQVFEGATNYTCMMFLEKGGSEKIEFVKVDDLEDWIESEKSTNGVISSAKVTAAEWNFSVGKGSDLFEKLKAMPVKLGDLADRMAQGIRTSANEVYVLDVVSTSKKNLTARSEALRKNIELERTAVSRFLQGREIKPYAIKPSGKVVIIPYEVSNGRAAFISEQEMNRRFPRTLAYLRATKPLLEKRERGRMRGRNWYAYVYPKNIEVMQKPKILVPDIADRASFALDENGEYTFTSGYGITFKGAINESSKYVLGLLNSRLLDWYLKKISTTMRGGFFRYFTQFIEQLPIRPIDFSNSTDKSRHDRIVTLVDRMLELNKKRHSGKLAPSEIDRVDRELASTDAEIDDLVYELYEITPEERKIVEQTSHGGIA